jgi:hypothetical protein
VIRRTVAFKFEANSSSGRQKIAKVLRRGSYQIIPPPPFCLGSHGDNPLDYPRSSQAKRKALQRSEAEGLADPRILILDEATSSVDAEAEYLIQQGLGEVLKARTALVIAYRLSTIRNADKIIALELATFCLWISLIGGFLDLNRACNLRFDLEAF